jgi:hypothetical protein
VKRWTAIILAALLMVGSVSPQIINPGSGTGGGSSGTAGGDLGGTYPNPTVANLSHVTNGSLANTGLANASTTVNGTACTLGSTCSPGAAPTGSAGGDLGGSYPNPTALHLTNVTDGSLANSGLAHSATTVNGQTCTLGSTCTVSIGVTPSGFFLNSGSNYYIGPTFQLATLPVAGNFAWIDQGGATETASGNALVLVAPSATGDNLRQQAISATTSLTVNMSCTGQVENYSSCGVGFRESATGKLVVLVNNIASSTQTCQPSGSNACQGAELQVSQFTNATTFSSANFVANWGPWTTQWLQLQISGSNLLFRTSQDGVNFVTQFTTTKTTFFTTAPDNWVYFSNSNNNVSTSPVTATLFSWLAQ